jgi:hypothetical protein
MDFRERSRGAIFDPGSDLFEQVALHNHENDEITNPKQARPLGDTDTKFSSWLQAGYHH